MLYLFDTFIHLMEYLGRVKLSMVHNWITVCITWDSFYFKNLYRRVNKLIIILYCIFWLSYFNLILLICCSHWIIYKASFYVRSSYFSLILKQLVTKFFTRYLTRKFIYFESDFNENLWIQQFIYFSIENLLEYNWSQIFMYLKSILEFSSPRSQ